MSDWEIVPSSGSDWEVVPSTPRGFDSPALQRRARQDLNPSKGPEPTFLERLGRGVKNLGTAVATTGGVIGEAVAHPIDTFSDPAKVSNLARGIDDMTTGGYGQQLGDWIGRKLNYQPSWAPDEQQMADASRFRTAGNVAGAFLPGAARIAGKGGAALAGKLLPKAIGTSRLGSAAAGAARGVVGYEAATVPLAAAQAHAAGADPFKAAEEAATDPLGLIMSVGGGTIAGGARGQTAKFRDPKTMAGQTLRTVEREGGKINPIGRPVSGGTFDRPEVASLPEGRAGMNQLAGQSRDVIKGHNKELLRNARQQYGQQVDDILAEHAEKSHYAEKSHATLDEMIAGNMNRAGKVIDKAVDKKLQHVKSLLTTTTDQLDNEASMAAGKAVYVSAPAVPVEDMIKVKKFVQDSAEWGKPADAKNRRFRLLSKSLNEDAAAVDPRIAEINAQYAKTMGQLEEANDILFASRKKEAPRSAAADKRAALKLGRIGDDTQAGTTDRLGRLGELDPAYAEQLRLLEAKKAVERLRYGEPEVSTGIEKGMGQAARSAAIPVVGGILGGIPGAMLGAGLRSATANPLSLKLRLGLPAAEMVGRGGSGRTGSLANRLAEMEQRRQEEQQRMARMLGAN